MPALHSKVMWILLYFMTNRLQFCCRRSAYNKLQDHSNNAEADFDRNTFVRVYLQ